MFVLTRENRVNPGTQQVVLTSDDRRKLEKQIEERTKQEDSDSGIKFTYKYMIHEVPHL